jgi:NAD(P)H dehydrogenase (quinone)
MILITGGSGRIGRRAAELLGQRGCALRVMTRDPQRIPRAASKEIVRGDFAVPATLIEAFAGISSALVISGSGKPGERAQLHRNAFEAAAQAGVRHVVYLSLQGASPDSNYPFNRDHAVSERYLAATGLPHTILRDSFYLDMFLDKFDAEGVVRGPAGEGRAAFVSREDVAQVAAEALISLPGGIHDVTGPQALHVADVARRLSVMTGRPLRYENESVEDGRARLSRSGMPDWKVDLELGWFVAIAAGELENTSDTVLRFTGRSPQTLEKYLMEFPDLLRTVG